MKIEYVILSLTLSFLSVGCASNNPEQRAALTDNEVEQESSSLDSYNESMHSFNQAAYEYVLNPIGNGLEFIIPDFVEDAVASIFDNLAVPNTAINNALQGKFKSSGHDLARFGINSTVGLLGMFDWATLMGIENNDEDLGQTLAYYGVESGPYVVLPLLGGATPRAMAGMFGSFDPINMTDKDTKKLAEQLGYVSMVTDMSGDEPYPSLEQQKKRFIAMRECTAHDGDESVSASCSMVCEGMVGELKAEYLAIEDAQERKEMREMAPMFAPSFCQLDFDEFERQALLN